MESQVPDMVFDLLCNSQGHLYICGDVKMADDVTNAVKRIFVKLGKMSKEKAENYVQEMKVRCQF